MYANRHRFSTREQLEQERARVEELISELIQRGEAADQAEEGEAETEGLPAELADGQKRRKAIKEALERIKQREAQQQAEKEQLAQSGRQSQAKEVRMNLTDPDCGILHRKGAGTVIGYNAQIGVDIQGAGLIVTNAVSAKGGDAELLNQVLEQLAPELGAVKEAMKVARDEVVGNNAKKETSVPAGTIEVFWFPVLLFNAASPT